MARRLALITGASAGIGAAFARIYASHGYDVALTARRLDRLEALAAEIRLRFGVEAYPIAADLSDPAGVDAVLAGIEAQGRVVDALVNNAGYGLPGTYAATRWEDQSAFLQVLLTSVCGLTHKVLPGMVERGYGRIVNVASLAGLTPGAAGHTLYAATKSFLVKFSQSLHLENQATGVHVSALCPGFTYSEFHDVNGTRAQVSQSLPTWLWLGADEVAAAGYEAAEANRAVCVPGAPNKAIAVLAKLIPDDWALALMASQGSRFRKV
ncbi:dehydrogenase [Caulobacter sp. Root655]|uniref:SDR family NAD(P)-dependent oxidoreductase n=1 Tax=Caulobacter sp. Root655 TaxID=1736578 RepID=UPI000700FA8B|nr:SDR family oxidoreductase [Caulobacter sp. Root655]KRA65983.1 dehydrogenase [Caulobacter sp. Root655]